MNRMPGQGAAGHRPWLPRLPDHYPPLTIGILVYTEQIPAGDHPSARVQPSCAPSKRSSSALTCGRSQEQPAVTDYATDPSRAARAASSFYQQRVPVNHELSRHREGLLYRQVIPGMFFFTGVRHDTSRAAQPAGSGLATPSSSPATTAVDSASLSLNNRLHAAWPALRRYDGGYLV